METSPLIKSQQQLARQRHCFNLKGGPETYTYAIITALPSRLNVSKVSTFVELENETNMDRLGTNRKYTQITDRKMPPKLQTALSLCERAET